MAETAEEQQQIAKLKGKEVDVEPPEEPDLSVLALRRLPQHVDAATQRTFTASWSSVVAQLHSTLILCETLVKKAKLSSTANSIRLQMRVGTVIRHLVTTVLPAPQPLFKSDVLCVWRIRYLHSHWQ